MLQRLLAPFLFLVALALPARATWSIIVLNRATGEVAIGAATCIPGGNLRIFIPAIVTGEGAGVIQAAGDQAGLVPMVQGILDGLTPEEIMLIVRAQEPSVGQLQAAVVTMDGGPVIFTGGSVGRARPTVSGQQGDLIWAIQGNVLTGGMVVTAAEQALLATEGDVGQKLMAAMEAARSFGGDGRCSCPFGLPTSCGSPPTDFQKSAHIGFLLVTRPGDPNGPCDVGNDCTSPNVHLALNIRGLDAQANDPDPVLQLAQRYVTWRANRIGRPDGVYSRAEVVDAMPADGKTVREVRVRLYDIEGDPLTIGGAKLSITSGTGRRLFYTQGDVRDHGDGTYSFDVRAGDLTGVDSLAIDVRDDFLRARIYPYPEIRFDPPAALHVGKDALGASSGGSVPFVLQDTDRAGAHYVVLGSLSGGGPGIPLAGGAVLPLEPDAVFFSTLQLAGDPVWLPGMRGVLDGEGRAEGRFLAPPSALLGLVGQRLQWAAVLVQAGRLVVTDAVSLPIEAH